MAFQNTSFWATGYHWDFGDGATSTEKNPVHEYAQPGVYTVMLMAQNWCSAETYSQEVAVGISDAQEPVAADLFQALPNPTTTGLIKLDLKQTSAADVRLYSLAGRLLLADHLAHGARIDLNVFGKGLHLLQVVADGQIYTEKVVSQ